MGLLKTLAQHRSDECRALRLKDRITDLETSTPKKIKSTNEYRRKIEDLKDEVDSRMNHSKFPSKMADSIHQIRKSKKKRAAITNASKPRIKGDKKHD